MPDSCVINNIYLRSRWRRLLSRVLPIRPVRTVPVNVRFVPDPKNDSLMTASVPEYGLSFVLDRVQGTVSGGPSGLKNVLGYDLIYQHTSVKKHAP